jgi:hypothetical protein
VTAYGGFTPYAAGVVAGCRCGRYLAQQERFVLTALPKMDWAMVFSSCMRETGFLKSCAYSLPGIRATPRHHDRDPHPLRNGAGISTAAAIATANVSSCEGSSLGYIDTQWARA